jgi:hypothetical protein
MTSSRVHSLPFDFGHVEGLPVVDPRLANWPVVYTLDGRGYVYVGESISAASRLRQHLDSADKHPMRRAHVIVDETFNKSACLDLESHLIRWLAGDGRLHVLNRNDGVIDAEYFERARYRADFAAVFDELSSRGLFSRSIQEIENGNLFKLSPFKALAPEQAIAIEGIVEGLFEDLESGVESTSVVQGDPGTGKTIVAIYLLKLLADIRRAGPADLIDADTRFSEFFVEGNPVRRLGISLGLVVPQQSLRKSIKNVFEQTPGLDADMVMSPFDVGESPDRFDLLVVDETHRLGQRANQPSAVLNRKFVQINERLFGNDDPSITQLDWIEAMSDHRVFLVDAGQTVRPADLPRERLDRLRDKARRGQRMHPLAAQQRVMAGGEYVTYVRRLFDEVPPEPRSFDGYDFRLYSRFGAMVNDLAEQEHAYGLSRLVAGYAWEWRSKKDKDAFDIEIEGVRLRWNTTAVDWVNSPNSPGEVGSIHTVQGYDLNYTGVIIGRDLRWDPRRRRVRFDRTHYYDAKGMENNRQLGITYSDDDLAAFVVNIYTVLLTRGMRGTYVYVCDEALRERLGRFIPAPPVA